MDSTLPFLIFEYSLLAGFTSAMDRPVTIFVKSAMTVFVAICWLSLILEEYKFLFLDSYLPSPIG